MSKGPGAIERKVVELFRASGWSGTDRTFTVDELAGEVFGVTVAEATELFPAIRPTRAQRVSVVRAAKSAMRRARKFSDRAHALRQEAHAAADAKFGPEKEGRGWRYDRERIRFVFDHPSYCAAAKIPDEVTDLVHWRATVLKDRSLIFHHGTRPVRMWAVEISAGGVFWDEAVIEEITSDRISVRYKGVRCPLPRPLGFHGCWWRAVRFVDERDGWTAEWIDRQWFEQYGHLYPARMELSVARAMLGLGEGYTRDDVIAGFRKAAKRCHPDLGGSDEQFRALFEARERLLSALGTSAPAPEMPTFTPRGRKTYYTTARSSHAPRIGGTSGLLPA